VRDTPCSRRALIKAGALGLVALTVPGCGPAVEAMGTTGGQGTSASTGGDTGTTGGGSSGSTGGTGTGGGTGGSGSTGGTTTGGLSCTPTTSCAAANANTLVLALADYPELAYVGGSVALTDARYRDPYCRLHGLVIIRTSATEFSAVSSSCTHQCCTVSNTGTELFCPCHGSIFDYQGNVLRGPAPRALPTIPVCFDGCSIFVQLA
jgi:Rieske Fe-S protein